jgi:Rrf2 family cysteine metabolism transcriptional repressor
MRISARCDYACRALLELSLHWPQETPLQIQQIAQKQDIPMKYLVQILIQLKREGIVSSSRGKDGGYLLAKAPGSIKLGQVIRCMGGSLLPIADSAKKKGSVFKGLWDEVEGAMVKILDNVTFGDIRTKSNNMEGVLMYQI